MPTNLEQTILRNLLTDEDYISGYLSSATGGGRFGQWGTPRIIGIEISRNF